MNKIKQTIKKQEEEFDKKFPELVNLSDGKTYKNIVDREKVKSHIKNSNQELIQAIIKELDKLREKDKPGEYGGGYDFALDEVEEILEEVLKK